MKIIHCADLHLDSKMNTHLSKDKARERKNELLRTFERMVDYASKNEVTAIIIAGDLFDTDSVSQKTQNVVIEQIRSHADISFYYLRGNHDANNFLSVLEQPLDNLFLFSEKSWSSYEIGKDKNIVISGVELGKTNSDFVYNTLLLDQEKFNIITLHGQEIATNSEKSAELVKIRELKNKGIDYLALGHVHAYKEEALDARGTYCYSGCLEGRGFDEIGEHGFVLLNIDEDSLKYSRSFIPFALRSLYECEVDISGSFTTPEILSKIEAFLADKEIPSDSLVKIILSGEVSAETEKDLEYIKSRFEGSYYFLRVVDGSKVKVNYDDYEMDQSLRGEFVRTVKSRMDISEEEKAQIIHYGLQAISGEEIVI